MSHKNGYCKDRKNVKHQHSTGKLKTLSFLDESAVSDANDSPLAVKGVAIMKDMMKNDDAVSVVVGAILILAVLVTFMSVVTSTWVPIYEGDAEAVHSDDTNKAFMDIHKQIELADEFARSASIDMGTDEMPFIKGSNSVGYLEVNGSGGDMFMTGNVTRQSAAWGEGFDIVGLNTSDSAPFTNLSFEFRQLDSDQIDYFSGPGSGPKYDRLNSNFMVKMWTTSMSRWITLYPAGLGSNSKYADELGIMIKYYPTTGDTQFWEGIYSVAVGAGGSDVIDVFHPNININLLVSNENITLIEPATGVTINGTLYTTEAPLSEVIQHYMKLPGDGTGGNYEIDYVQYDGILDATQHITYKTVDEGTSMFVNEDGMITNVLNDFKIGGGTLKLQSDYNFMVDQSYIYDSGAVILSQYDGEVFKVEPPFVATNNSDGNLILTIKSTVMTGEYQASGNDIETLYTALDGNVYEVSGVTDNVTIMKNTTSKLYPLWHSYFSKLGNEILDLTTTCNITVLSNSSINQVGININSNNPDITLTVQKKVVKIS
ncbi:MAG: hypothetical protein Q7J10_09545 [Methanosarcinaceae archaeon]|nr:hypothetical protein [Methanosarcinaceae archaeon]